MATLRHTMRPRLLCRLCAKAQLRHSSSTTITRPLQTISTNTHPTSPTTAQRHHNNSQSIAHYSTKDSPNSPPNPSPSVDPSEISHFSTLASSWWDPHGPSRLLHLMNPLRHTFISRCMYSVEQDQYSDMASSASSSPPPLPETLRYLDIGCGGGIFAESAARLPTTASVLAIDASPDVLAIAKAHARGDPLLQPPKLTYLHSSIEELAMRRSAPASSSAAIKGEKDGQQQQQQQEDPGLFDIVSLFEVIEHIPQPSPFLEKVIPFVKPGGWLVMSTIARTWTSWFTTKLVAEEIIRMVPRGTHDWERYINESELREWFAKKSDWGDARSLGVVYVPGLGWQEVRGSENWGNYFFAIRRLR